MLWIPEKDSSSMSLAWRTPIEIYSDGYSEGDTSYKMCRLDFMGYSLTPYLYPMFKDLTKLSNCDATSSIATMADIRQDILAHAGSPAGRVLYPTAFIFHESRVGSTLLANMLAADETNMVFSESNVPAELFR